MNFDRSPIRSAWAWLRGDGDCDRSDSPHCKFFRGVTAAIFIACLLRVNDGLFAFLEVPVLVVIAHTQHLLEPEKAGATSKPTDEIAIVKISPLSFQDEYGSTQPLERCALHADLERLTGGDPDRIVAVDIGLAPPRRLTHGPPTAYLENECACQQKIDALLDSRPGRWILLYPFEFHFAGELIEKREATDWYCTGEASAGQVSRDQLVRRWTKDRERMGASFHAAVATSDYGMVVRTSLEAESGSTGSDGRFGDMARAVRRSMIAANDADPPRCPLRSVCSYPIAFGALKDFYARGHALCSHDVCVQEPNGKACVEAMQMKIPFRPCDCGSKADAAGNQGLETTCDYVTRPGRISHLLFGAGYTADDEHLTPIGILSGVEVMAATAARPYTRKNKGLEFGADVLIGVAAERVFQRRWRRLLASAVAARRNRADDRNLVSTFNSVVFLLISFAVFAAIAFGLSWWAMRHGFWVNPVGMIVGMAVAAFVLGSVEAALERGGEAVVGPPPIERTWRPGRSFLRIFGSLLFISELGKWLMS